MALKLWSLTLKTLSKPLANRFKAKAQKQVHWRTVFATSAQYWHAGEYRLRARWVLDVPRIDVLRRRWLQASGPSHQEGETA